MKFLFDLLPVILFFVAFKAYDIYVGTGVLIVATTLQVTWLWFRHRKVDTAQWVSLALVAVFGSATLLLHDESFIKWKPTILYWLFAGIIFGADRFFSRNVIRKMLEQQMRLPDALWRRLSDAWVIFFALMGCLNLYIAFNFSTDDWVNFKLFGGMGLMIAFIIAQGMFLAKYIEPDPEEKS
ncbi:MAG: septation protein A [Rhodocyclaceae bacterium]|nr:septation protein A [Rhodocyclaceae bacterium]